MSLVSLISSGDNSIIVIIVAGGSILEGEKKGEENILISRGLSDGADGLVRLGTTQ